MLEQEEGETRLNYLMRVLDYFMSSTIAGDITVLYDETECDGYCLVEDIKNAIDDELSGSES